MISCFEKKWMLILGIIYSVVLCYDVWNDFLCFFCIDRTKLVIKSILGREAKTWEN